MYRRYGKRVFDLVLTVPTLVVLSPVIAVVAVLVRLKHGAPVLFGQVRPGMHGKPFKMYKFRTMRDDRDATGNLLPDEERLTRFGAALRRTSLDELPELWNVVRGDMSIVGPRPLLMRYLPRYTPEQMRRHDALPGITGWAQIHGRNTLTWESRFAYDLYYVDRASLALDVVTIAMTVAKVLAREGITAEVSDFWGTAGPPTDGPAALPAGEDG